MARRGWLSGFSLLMWKNWLLQRRHPIQTVIEIAAPVFFSALLVVVRSLVVPVPFNQPTEFLPFLTTYTPNLLPPELTLNNTKWVVPWAPDHPELRQIMAKAAWAGGFQDIMFASEDTMLANITSENEDIPPIPILAGIVFDGITQGKLPSELKMRIRFPSTSGKNPFYDPAAWTTEDLFPDYQIPGPRTNSSYGGPPDYAKRGFLALQHQVSMALVEYLQQKPLQNVTVLMQRFPYPRYIQDPLLEALQSFVSLIFMLSFVYTCINTVRMVTTEKERQLKESMKIMGLANWLHWTAWFMNFFTLLTIATILMTVLVKVKWYGNGLAVFTYSEGTVVFLFLLLFATSCITFSFLISTLFSKANTAATVAGVAWFFNYAPYYFLLDSYGFMSFGEKMLSSLASNTAMAYGCQFIIQYEGTGEGLQWSNLFKAATPDDNFSLGAVMCMLLVDTILYMLIALYIEAIFPGDYGVPKPWYFPFQKSFWFGDASLTNKVHSIPHGTFVDSFFEEEPDDLKAGIKIKGLRKVFDNKVAVSNLNLNMYEGQITVLLGHNGAGKTTTMSMLTGLLTSTSGTADVGGHDICTDIQGVRESLGLCPQHNILFGELTVKEHLQFYCKLKGLSTKEVDSEVKKYIKLLDFESKTNALSSTLSGGMQRKLSVGVALCGGSKVVMLDEPTSGMDPSARRTLWDVLEAEKEGRTVLLTTHFMDEADLLGDRIAIMAGGQLQCCGSSFFLKKKYGTGYYLIIAKGKDCDVIGITALLRKYIPDIQVGQNIGSELSYQLPDDKVSVFESMMFDLENHSEELGMLSYGVSLTTMEEVFVKAGRDQEVTLDQAEHTEVIMVNANGNMEDYEHENYNSRNKLNISSAGLYTGPRLLWNQFTSMLMKKSLSTLRSWLLYCIQVGLPVAFLIIVILVSRVFVAKFNDHPPLKMSLGSYSKSITVAELTRNAVKDVPDLYGKYQAYVKPYTINTVPSTEDMSTYMIKRGDNDLVAYRTRYISGATFDYDSTARKTVVTAWFSNQPLHGVSLALNLVHNAILRQYIGEKNSITVTNHPLPYDKQSKITRQLASTLTKGFQYAFNIGFSLAFVSAFYVLFYVRERVCKSKHLQIVSGVEGLTYWVASFLWDLFLFLGPTLGIIITFTAFQEEGFSSWGELGRLFLVLMMFAWCVLPVVYLSAYLFDIPANGFSRLTILSTFLGVAAFMVVVVLKTPTLKLVDVGKILEWVFMIFPHFNVTISIYDLYLTYLTSKICVPVLEYCADLPGRGQTNMCCKEPIQCPNSTCLDWTQDYFAYDSTGIGRQLVYFAVEGFVLMIVVILLEYRLFDDFIYNIKQRISRFKKSKTFKNDLRATMVQEIEDTDVSAEKYYIRNTDIDVLNKKYKLILRDVTKYYGNFLAVNQLSIGIESGECFGLLGINGAGKTTTFKMLTGDERISSGDAFLSGLSLTSEMKQVHQLIGYCPQFDALLDDLTGRETLTMFCLLRGVPWHKCKKNVDRLAEELLFTKHIDKKVKEYSGGNKRKLSTAVALVGDPPVIYLDEPTTGMDPVAKRHLWNIVCKVRDLGKSIILTSHSMEECEALCTKLAIMVNGEFKCLGSTQYLKSKFAEGYTLMLKVKHIIQQNSLSKAVVFDMQPAKEFVASNFPGAILKEDLQGMLSYYIPNPHLTWSQMFGLMEKAKNRLNIEDYSLGQTSLEQVFLTFTKSQLHVD